jgi:hypothetical protein
MGCKNACRTLACAMLVGAVLLQGQPTRAEDETARLERLERQIDALQKELRALKRQQAGKSKSAPQRSPTEAGVARAESPVSPEPAAPDDEGSPHSARTPPPGTPLPAEVNVPKAPPSIRPAGVNIALGGYIEAAGIYRTRNEVSDMASDFNTGMPLPNSPLYHEREFRGSARGSRLSLLASGDIDPVQHLAAYFETDFLGAGVTANSRHSNAYNPRLRQAYASYDNDDWHFHLLAGQSWSLMTQFKEGIVPREENIPRTIDSQHVVGFSDARVPQVRLVGDWDKIVWFGVSAESPQVNFLSNSNGAGDVGGSPIPPGLGINDLNTCMASGLLNSETACSNDTIPNVVEKVAFDPGWGHYEAFAVQRWFTDRVFVNSIGSNKTTFGWSVGGSVLLPVIPGRLDLQGSVMTGEGIGLYGPALLPDVTIAPDGSLAAIPVTQVLVGAVARPWPSLEVYAYAGREQANARAWNVGSTPIGYGNPLFDNSGCFAENPASGPADPNDPITPGTCAANTRSSNEITAGFWQDLYRGNLGRFVVGAQYEYIQRITFPGQVNGVLARGPNPNEQVVMTSIRYYPFP